LIYVKNLIDCKLATIDSTEYPIIRLVIKKHNPDRIDSEDFIKKLFDTIDFRTGPYVLLLDGSNAKWVRGSSRDILGTGMQHIEGHFKDRHQMNFLHTPNVILWFLIKLLNKFIKSEIPQKIFFKLEDAEKEAKGFIKDFAS